MINFQLTIAANNPLSSTKPPTLLDDIHHIMRLKHYSNHTERTYCDWIKQFVKFHRMSEKQQLFIDSETKIEAFLTYLATGLSPLQWSHHSGDNFGWQYYALT